MNQNYLAHVLMSLVKLDLDAARGYEHALRRIDDHIVQQQLETFRRDHEQHVTALNELALKLDVVLPEQIADLNCFFRDPASTLQRMNSGSRRVLQALRVGERIAEKTYSDALRVGLPEPAIPVIMRHHKDERYHMEYIIHSLEHWQLQI